MLFSCGNKPFLEAANKHRLELKPFGRMHSHHLQGILTRLRLVIACLERRMRQKARKRRQLRCFDVALRAGRIRGVALFHHERRRCVNQLVQILNALFAFLLGLIVRNQPALLNYRRNDFRQRQVRNLAAQRVDQRDERAEVRPCLAA